jgi:ATP-dependent RNA helicase DeaD
MVRLSLSRGRNHGIKVNEVVGTLANYADIPGKSIGRINIQDQQTFVDVHEQFAGKVLAKTGTFRIRKQSIDVRPA